MPRLSQLIAQPLLSLKVQSHCISIVLTALLTLVCSSRSTDLKKLHVFLSDLARQSFEIWHLMCFSSSVNKYGTQLAETLDIPNSLTKIWCTHSIIPLILCTFRQSFNVVLLVISSLAARGGFRGESGEARPPHIF